MRECDEGEGIRTRASARVWAQDGSTGTRARARVWDQDGASPVPTIYDDWSQWGKQWVRIY